MRQFEDQRSMLPYVCGLTLCLVVLSVCLGCGGTRASAVSASSSSVAPASSESDSLGSLLGEIARAVKPMPLYGWLRLPAGARVPDQWWPALDLSAPSEYRGGPVDNPWVTGADSTEPQMQYLLQIGGGWIMLWAIPRAIVSGMWPDILRHCMMSTAVSLSSGVMEAAGTECSGAVLLRMFS
jgi:hypothetical protein